VNSARGRLYGPLLLSLGVTLAVATVTLTLQMLAAVIGPFRLFAPPASAAPRDLGVWLPASATGGQAVATTRQLRAWREATGGERAVREVRSLAELDPAEPPVIALADASSLSAGEVAGLVHFLEGGGAAIVTGAVGVRSPAGGWRGYGVMERLLQVSRVVPLAPGAADSIAAARRGPISAPLRADQQIALRSQSGAPGIDDPGAELRWTGTEAGVGASRRLRIGRGRLLWLAAGPESLARGGGVPSVSGDAARLLAASVAWAAAEPFAELLAWPDRARFAAHVDRDGHAPAPLPESLERAGSMPAMKRVIAEEIARAERIGGLARVAVPEDLLGEPRRSELLDWAERRIRARGAWLAIRAEISTWRRLHGGVSATLDRVGPQRSVLGVTNDNREAVRGAVLRVHVNRPVLRAEVQRTTLQQASPALIFERRAERVDIALPDLPGDTSQAFSLDLEVGS
jgi:hypothetical protein